MPTARVLRVLQALGVVQVDQQAVAQSAQLLDQRGQGGAGHAAFLGAGQNLLPGLGVGRQFGAGLRGLMPQGLDGMRLRARAATVQGQDGDSFAHGRGQMGQALGAERGFAQAAQTVDHGQARALAPAADEVGAGFAAAHETETQPLYAANAALAVQAILDPLTLALFQVGQGPAVQGPGGRRVRAAVVELDLGPAQRVDMALAAAVQNRRPGDAAGLAQCGARACALGQGRVEDCGGERGQGIAHGAQVGGHALDALPLQRGGGGGHGVVIRSVAIAPGRGFGRAAVTGGQVDQARQVGAKPLQQVAGGYLVGGRRVGLEDQGAR